MNICFLKYVVIGVVDRFNIWFDFIKQMLELLKVLFIFALVFFDLCESLFLKHIGGAPIGAYGIQAEKNSPVFEWFSMWHISSDMHYFFKISLNDYKITPLKAIFTTKTSWKKDS